MSPATLRGHKRVLIDTSIWIYHFEQHPKFAAPAGDVIADLEEGRFRGISSELTLLELVVRPLQLGRQDAADDYELLLSYFPNLELAPVGRDPARCRRAACALPLAHARCDRPCHGPAVGSDGGGYQR